MYGSKRVPKIVVLGRLPSDFNSPDLRPEPTASALLWAKQFTTRASCCFNIVSSGKASDDMGGLQKTMKSEGIVVVP